MNVSLTPEVNNLSTPKWPAGHYGTASEVVHEGLRLLAEQDQLREIKLAALRKDIEDGLKSGEYDSFGYGSDQERG